VAGPCSSAVLQNTAKAEVCTGAPSLSFIFVSDYLPLSYCEIFPFLNGAPMDIGAMILYEPLCALLDSKREKKYALSIL
jgi:hypothetical protein